MTQIHESDCATGVTTLRDMTVDEQAAYDAQQVAVAAATQAQAAAASAEQTASEAAATQRIADTATLHDALTAMGLPDAAAALLRILAPPAA